jgi:predicted DNA-binding transcriptional regulator AlpA
MTTPIKLLTSRQTADLLGLKPHTLETWRWRGVGPRHVRCGRLIRYAEADVLAWIEAQTHQNTTQNFDRQR